MHRNERTRLPRLPVELVEGEGKMEVFTKREVSKMTNEEAQKHLEELIAAYPLIFDQFTMLQEAAWKNKVP